MTITVSVGIAIACLAFAFGYQMAQIKGLEDRLAIWQQATDECQSAFLEMASSQPLCNDAPDDLTPTDTGQQLRF